MKISKLTTLVLVLGTIIYCPKVDARNLPNILESPTESRRLLAQVNPLAEAYYKRGNALFKSGDFQDAIRLYNKAIHINPNYAEAYVGRGNALSESGNLKAADVFKTPKILPLFVNAKEILGIIIVLATGTLTKILNYPNKEI